MLRKNMSLSIMLLIVFFAMLITAAECDEGQPPSVTLELDKTSLSNGGVIKVSGRAPVGKEVFLQLWAEKKVRASRFDSEIDKETGKRPYVLYITDEMPAYFKIFTPRSKSDIIEAAKKEGKKWSFSKAIKDLGADDAYSSPAKINIERYQATLLGSVIGSRGDVLPKMAEKENKKVSMQLVKARFRLPNKVLDAIIEINPDGTYKADVKLPKGLAPGKYFITAVVDKNLKSNEMVFNNEISFPNIYLTNAGSTLNIFGPFFLTLAIVIFGILMGAGGGFIMNPLFVSIWQLPHTIVAGTVMPTVLFSQGSGIYCYSKIKFISWKLGVTVGLSMVLGGFIGPKLTEMITLDQFKYVFGWILLVLAGLMFWQTTPGYVAKNKKEQAIINEFKKQAARSCDVPNNGG